MPAPLVSIGLEPHVVEELKRALGHIVAHDALPRVYSRKGQAFVESPSVWGSYLRPRGVLYYCYFDNPGTARRALALSSTPTFPDVRATLPHDDKALSLIAAVKVDPAAPIARGFIPAEQDIQLAEGETCVAKWGAWHCGEGKERFRGTARTPEPAVLEPFVDGESHRVLIVGNRAWQLRYKSDDWRKNVSAAVNEVPADSRLVARARATAGSLGLTVAGIDYILTGDAAVLLEVNAYPGLDQAAGAEREFIDLAIAWGKTIEEL